MAAIDPVPSVDEVLNKLKSNGTFDQFRKTCLAAVEAEPSFRAYGEHIEVVSRRYLQNYKWRDTTTKNQVRSRLKDHALSVIASPDIQVGVPFSSLVEKAMESKGKELLPKIEEIVRALGTTNKPVSVYSSEVSVSGMKDQTKENNNTFKAGMEFDLSLPIDLPGLGPVTKKDVSTGGDGGSAKPVKARPKLVVDSNVKGGGSSSSSSSGYGKGGGGGGGGGKGVGGSTKGSKSGCVVTTKADNKIADVIKDVKVKEKEDQKLLSEGKKESRGKQLKKETEDKELQEQPKDVTTSTEEVIERKEKTDKTLCDRKGSERKAKTTKGAEDNDRTTAFGKEFELQEKDTNNNDILLNADAEKKPFPSRRRSARLASLTEEQEKEEHIMDSDLDMNHHSSEDDVLYATKTRATKRNRKNESGALRQKRARILESDSDNSGRENEKGMAARTQQEREKLSSRKRPSKQDHEVTRDTRKSLSRTASPASTGSSTSSALQMAEGTGHHRNLSEQIRYRRKLKCPQRVLQSSRSSKSPIKSPPPPPVVTRSNRYIIPNRRYYASSEEEDQAVDSGQIDEESFSSMKKTKR